MTCFRADAFLERDSELFAHERSTRWSGSVRVRHTISAEVVYSFASMMNKIARMWPATRGVCPHEAVRTSRSRPMAVAQKACWEERATHDVRAA